MKIKQSILILLFGITTYFLSKISNNYEMSALSYISSDGKEQFIEQTNFILPLEIIFILCTCFYIFSLIQSKMISFWFGIIHLFLSLFSYICVVFIIDDMFMAVFTRSYYSFSHLNPSSSTNNVENNKIELIVLLLVFILGQYFLYKNIRNTIK